LALDQKGYEVLDRRVDERSGGGVDDVSDVLRGGRKTLGSNEVT
jgi:hypothetical protein